LLLLLLQWMRLLRDLDWPENNESQTNWVVRGGLAQAQSLIQGYLEHKGHPGLYGLSVQYAPGSGLSEDALAAAGEFRNSQFSYATDSELIIAGAGLGYTILLVPSSGRGEHYTLSVEGHTSLPVDLANALSGVWAFRPKKSVPS
jgi:hypothetical protein